MGVLKPPNLGIPVLAEPTSICRALVGLADVDVVGMLGWTVPMQVYIEASRVLCRSYVGCGSGVEVSPV